ncbi:SNARE protein Syntaxin 1 [Pseudoloma neurophilia]|uniref:SNARE protein Syntaxin 1 n=1 Tax=Pseudoloma neurophilia TaxID=146866 RepID=A0A0R0M0T8_9MICR|nr:SNARE protein Syntaxin 1 [Pseudoloma neurophilia]
MINRFLDKCNLIEEDIAKLHEYIERMRYYGNYKSNSVLSEKDEKKLDNKIHILNGFFKKKSHKVKEELKEIHNENQNLSIDDDEFIYNTRNDRWEVMTRELSETIELYRTEQLEHSKEEKKRLKSQFLIANPDATEEELHELVNSETGEKVLQKEFTSGSSSAKNLLSKATDRNKNIKKILESINELVALIEELDEMVHNSGKLVDKIEIEVDITKKTVKQAKRDLVKARNYQRATMYIKYLILGVLLLAFGFSIIGLVLFGFARLLLPTTRNNKNSNNLNSGKNNGNSSDKGSGSSI